MIASDARPAKQGRLEPFCVVLFGSDVSRCLMTTLNTLKGLKGLNSQILIVVRLVHAATSAVFVQVELWHMCRRTARAAAHWMGLCGALGTRGESRYDTGPIDGRGPNWEISAPARHQ